MTPDPMTSTELAAWTAQQSARHETTAAPRRAARSLDAGLDRILSRPSERDIDPLAASR